jgi:hypothetical protein
MGGERERDLVYKYSHTQSKIYSYRITYINIWSIEDCGIYLLSAIWDSDRDCRLATAYSLIRHCPSLLTCAPSMLNPWPARPSTRARGAGWSNEYDTTCAGRPQLDILLLIGYAYAGRRRGGQNTEKVGSREGGSCRSERSVLTYNLLLLFRK